MNRIFFPVGLSLGLTLSACGTAGEQNPGLSSTARPLGLDLAEASVSAYDERFGCPVPLEIIYVDDAQAGTGFNGATGRAKAEQGKVILDNFVLDSMELSKFVPVHEAVHACTDGYVEFEKPYIGEGGIKLVGSDGFQVKMIFPDGQDNYFTFPDEGVAELLAQHVTGVDSTGMSDPTYVTMSIVSDSIRLEAGPSIEELQELYERSDVESLIAAYRKKPVESLTYDDFVHIRDQYHLALGLSVS